MNDPLGIRGHPNPISLFNLKERLGKGAYGSVYKAEHKSTKQVFAVKQISLEEADLNAIAKEINILKECDNDHIIRYYGHFMVKGQLWIVMENCGGGAISNIMEATEKCLTEPEIACIFSDILDALEFLHRTNKIHRDIKAGNILIDDSSVSKLADFGVSGQLGGNAKKRHTMIGTPFWMAPEVIQNTGGYGTKADIWSLGITAIELYVGKPPRADMHPMKAIFKIPKLPPPEIPNKEKMSPVFISFITNCLKKNPQDRPSAAELRKHAFLTQYENVNEHQGKISLKLKLKILQDRIKSEGRGFLESDDDSTDSDDEDESTESSDEEEEDSDGDSEYEYSSETMIINTNDGKGPSEGYCGSILDALEGKPDTSMFSSWSLPELENLLNDYKKREINEIETAKQTIHAKYQKQTQSLRLAIRTRKLPPPS